MSIITTSIPVTSGAIAQASQPAQVTRPDTANPTNAANLGTQAAAVVSLSAGKARSTSRGDSRSVDGAFEKQEAKKKETERKDEASADSKDSPAHINVKA